MAGFLTIAVATLAVSLSDGQVFVQRPVAAEFTRAVELFNEHDDTGEALAEAEQAFARVLARQPRHAPARAYQGLESHSSAARRALRRLLSGTRCRWMPAARKRAWPGSAPPVAR